MVLIITLISLRGTREHVLGGLNHIRVYLLLLFIGNPRNFIFSPRSDGIDQLQSEGPQTINHGSRKAGQAAGAGGLKQNRYVRSDLAHQAVFCVCGVFLG
jgi:hypothetical protein